MAPMEDQLHAAKKPRSNVSHRRRAGLPVKRFFTRFARISDVPAEDLEALSESLRRAMDVDPASQVSALQALVRREILARGAADSN
jgi:hypothetical protein